MFLKTQKYKGIIKYLRNRIIIKLFNVLKLLPLENNKIVITNYYGKGYGDNPKYIVEEIRKRKLDYRIVWLTKPDLLGKCEYPEGVESVAYGSIAGMYELATAKLWIDNCRKSFYPPKRKSQYYIQTWHGGIALKRIEKDVENSLAYVYVRNAINDSRMADLFISNGNFCTNMYKNSFWYSGEILECGSPRCDMLVNTNNEVINKVRDKFEIDLTSNIILYAPTFRSDFRVDVYNIDFSELLLHLSKKFGGDWIILVRLHPNISEKADFIDYNERIINATNYDDMYELLSASDILLTDYSSTMFEFSISKKPVFLYAPDIEIYSKDRNFYFDLDELPFSICRNIDDLKMSIENYNDENYQSKLDKFFDEVGLKENGTAAECVVDRVQNVMQ